MQHPDEGTIHAWLDGQLSPEEGAAVESHARDCASCAAAIAEARGLVAASSRIISALDIVPGGVIPGSAVPAIKQRRPWYAGTQLRAAAAVLFVAAASMFVLRDQGSRPIAETSDRALITTDTEAAQSEDGAAPQAAAVANADAAATTELQSAETTAPSTAQPSVGSARQGRGQTGSIQSAPQRTAPSRVVDEADLSLRKRVENPPAADQRSPERRAAFGATLKAEPATAARIAASDASKQEITLVRADTAGRVDVMVYRVAEGIEVTLTETPATIESDFSGKGVATTGVAGKQRQSRNQAQAAESGVAAAAPPPPLPAPAAISLADSIRPLPVSSITWIDPVTKRTRTLSGRLSKERLEQLRKEIEQKRR